MSAATSDYLSVMKEHLREACKWAFHYLEETMKGVTPELAHWQPPGIANPIGATYAHIVLSQDGMLNGMIRGQAPLFVSTWAGRVGVSEPPPPPSPDSTELPDWSGWSRRVHIDLEAMQPYAQAVYASVDDYLAALTVDELDRELDLTFIGLGKISIGAFMFRIGLSHIYTHCGEIACLKGLQGVKGYPV
ncbi:MAG: DinB family protein [Chloroflexaceae bacterium]|nr:DinB family protein [Chloroflexaceae bacterium]